MTDPRPDNGGSRRWGRRALLVGLATLIPAVPIVVAIAITSGGPGAGAATTTPFTPVNAGAAAAPAHVAPAAQPAGGGTARATQGAAAQGAAPPGTGALVALVRHATTMRDAPGGSALAQLSTRTEFGSPEVLWVIKRAHGWLGVASPLAGNGQVGWIPQSATSLSRVSWLIEVSLSARRLTVIDAGKVMQRYTVAIGQPDAPTPTGRFAVTDRLTTGNPSGPYGCCILALTAKSPHAIQGWTGGNRIAIHSTPDTGSIGQSASHGCLRVTLAEGRWLMNHVPLGTPTLIGA